MSHAIASRERNRILLISHDLSIKSKDGSLVINIRPWWRRAAAVLIVALLSSYALYAAKLNWQSSRPETWMVFLDRFVAVCVPLIAIFLILKELVVLANWTTIKLSPERDHFESRERQLFRPTVRIGTYRNSAAFELKSQDEWGVLERILYHEGWLVDPDNDLRIQLGRFRNKSRAKKLEHQLTEFLEVRPKPLWKRQQAQQR